MDMHFIVELLGCLDAVLAVTWCGLRAVNWYLS